MVARMATGAPAECEAIRAAIHGGRRHGVGTVESYPTWFEGDAPWIVTSPEQSETLRLLETKFAPIEHSGLAHVGIGVATGCDQVFIVDKDADIDQVCKEQPNLAEDSVFRRLAAAARRR